MVQTNIDVLYANAITGPVVANAAQAIAGSASNIVVTPSSLTSYMQAVPTKIGRVAPCDANFNDVTAKTLGGDIVATQTDILDATSTSKFVSPAMLKVALANTSAIVGGSASTGVFSDLLVTGNISITTGLIKATAGGTGHKTFTKGDIIAASASNALDRIPIGNPGQVLTVDYGSPTFVRWLPPSSAQIASTTASGVIQLATNLEAINGTNITKAVTPGTLTSTLRSPPTIGYTTPGDAIFANLTAKNLYGVTASQSEALSYTSKTKAITPNNIPYIMASPGPIGGNTASTGTFTTLNTTTTKTVNLEVVNAPWLAVAVKYATNADMINATSSGKAATPAGVKYYLARPHPIGSSVPNTGTFTTLTATDLVVANKPWISDVPVFAQDADLGKNTTNTIVSPHFLKISLESPPVIGFTTPNNAIFTEVAASNIYGIIGDPENNTVGYFTDIYADGITGGVVATNSEAVAMTSNTKVITPSVFPAVMAAPGAIGNTTPGTGSFTTLAASMITGNIVATPQEVAAGSSNVKVVTPNTMLSYLASPGTIGGQTPGDAYFSVLNCESFTGAVATEKEVTDGGEHAKVIVPDILKLHLSSPNPIGDASPNTGKFTTLTAQKINGAVQCSLIDVYDGTSTDSVVSPSVFKAYMDSPGVIGGLNPEDANFKTLTVASFNAGSMSLTEVSGGVVATQEEVFLGESNSKVVTPSTLLGDLLSPPIIGQTKPNDAIFTGIETDSIQGDVIASAQEMIDGSINKVVTPSALQIYLADPCNIGSGSATGSFSTVSAGTLVGELGSSDIYYDAYIEDLYIKAIHGGDASNTEAITPSVTSKYITPSTLNYVLSNPPIIGATTANNIRALNVYATSGSGPIVASASDINTGTATTKFTTPKAVKDVLLSPPVIGDTVPNDAKFKVVYGALSGIVGSSTSSTLGYFTDIYADSINGSAIADALSVQEGTSTSTVITPSTLKNILTSPAYSIGDGSTDCHFASIYGTLIGVVGDPQNPLDGNFDVITASSISGSIVATQEAVSAGVSSTTIVTPETLAGVFKNPPILGSDFQNEANFTTASALLFLGDIGDSDHRHRVYASTLDATYVEGDCLATYANIVTPTGNKIVNDSLLSTILAKPLAIGSSVANSGTFTNLSASQLLGPLGTSSSKSTVSASVVTTDELNGDCIATLQELQAGVGDIDKVVSSSALLDFLRTPNGVDIGDGSGNGSFDALSANSLQGCIASLAETYAGTSETLAVSPSSLMSILIDPIDLDIGSGTSFAGMRAEIGTFNQIQGTCVATVSDIQASDNTKIVSGSSLNLYLNQADTLGSLAKTVIKAKSITSNQYYGPIGDGTVYNNAYFDALTCETITGNVIGTSNDLELYTENKVVTPALLQNTLDSLVAGAHDVNFQKLVVETIEITNDQITVPEGGTGYSYYEKGDLLVGDGSGLTKLHANVDGQLLMLDSTTISGLKWGNSPYPTGFQQVTPPKYVSNSNDRFIIQSCYARDYTNTINIDITSGKTLNLGTIGLNGVAQSDILGTATCAGTTVTTSDTDFTTLFVVNDVITFSDLEESRKIIGINSSTTLTIESAFSVDATSSYTRGGLASNTHYYMYASSMGGYIASTRSVTNGDILVDHSGYVSQLPYVATTDSFANVYQNLYLDHYVSIIPNNISFDLQDSFQYYSVANVVPRNATAIKIQLRMKNNTNADNDIYVRCQGADASVTLGGVPSMTFLSDTIDVALDPFSRFQAMVLDTSLGSYGKIILQGYYV